MGRCLEGDVVLIGTVLILTILTGVTVLRSRLVSGLLTGLEFLTTPADAKYV